MNLPDFNVLYNKDFRFELARLPTVGYFCNSITLPSLASSVASVPTPFVVYKTPGDHLVFSAFTVQFKVDKNFANYLELFNWMVSYGFPDNHGQFRAQYDIQSKDAFRAQLSDATIFTSTNKDNPNMRFVFEGCFPVDLGEIELHINEDNVQIVTCSATFEFTKFTIAVD